MKHTYKPCSRHSSAKPTLIPQGTVFFLDLLVQVQLSVLTAGEDTTMLHLLLKTTQLHLLKTRIRDTAHGTALCYTHCSKYSCVTPTAQIYSCVTPTAQNPAVTPAADGTVVLHWRRMAVQEPGIFLVFSDLGRLPNGSVHGGGRAGNNTTATTQSTPAPWRQPARLLCTRGCYCTS